MVGIEVGIEVVFVVGIEVVFVVVTQGRRATRLNGSHAIRAGEEPAP